MFEGTLNYTRDHMGRIEETDEVGTAGVVWTDAELRSRYGLDDKQVGLYKEMRKSVDLSLSNLAISEMIRFSGEDANPISSMLLDTGKVDEAADILTQYLDSIAQAEPERADDMAAKIKGVNDRRDKAQSLMDRGYAPLSRFGKFKVEVRAADGELEYFSMFESNHEVNKAARALAEEFPNSTVSTGVMSQLDHKLFQGVTPETLALFADAVGVSTNEETAQLFQDYLRLTISNRSAMKRLIKRKGIAGYSEDATRVLAGFVTSNARRTASNVHLGEISRSINKMEKNDTKDQAIKLYEYVINPQEEAQAIKGLMFAQYIGGSIASAMVNMTQPITMTLPYLSQFVGGVRAGAHLTAAFKQAAAGIDGDADLAEALKRAEDDGTVSPQEVHQLQAHAAGKGNLQFGDGTKVGNALATASNAISKFQLAWGKLFSAAEQYNRRVTFIAAYKIAREQGNPDPFAFAEKAIQETQGVYNKGNKPAWARGAIGSTLFTFKQYSISYVEFLNRMWGNGPEGKRAVGLAMAVMFLLSGAGGLPGADDLDDVIDAIMQRLGYNYPSKQAKREFFAKLLGSPAAAEFALRGISGIAGVPIDVSGRLGVGKLIPGTGLLLKKKDHTQDYKELAGPAGDMLGRAVDSAGMLVDGEVSKAFFNMSPKAVRDVQKSADMAKTGMYRDNKGKKVIDTTTGDAISKAIGFQPNRVAQVQQSDESIQDQIALNRLVSSEIADKMAQARFMKDDKAMADAKAELADWNLKNPDTPIRIKPESINKRVQQMNMDKAKRMAKTAPQAMRATVRKELESVR